MRIYGLDFTSAPRRRKPITCAACDLDGDHLSLVDFEEFPGFEPFEAFLQRPGPWIAGLDFPFGQPTRLIEALGWGRTWAEYVGVVAGKTKRAFLETLAAYRAQQPPGDKQHLRSADELADSRSPMMVYGVPVGRMFFQGAPRLLASGVSVIPCHPTGDNRIVLESYPALVARRWIGKQGYKSDTRRKQTAQHTAARQAIVDGLRANCRAFYGFDLVLDDTLAAGFVADPGGDRLDAVLCAVQAAWAVTQPDYGIPPGCDPAEGWIVDPAMARGGI
jgi:hypothetical protein